MTLDIKKMILNAVIQQQKIHHMDRIGEDPVHAQVFTKTELEEKAPKATAKIKDIYGATFLEDAELMLFFSCTSGFSKDLTKSPNGTLFKTIDSALSKDANKLSEGDIKRFDFDEEQSNEPEAEESSSEAAEDNTEEKLGESVESPEAGEKFVFVKINLK